MQPRTITIIFYCTVFPFLGHSLAAYLYGNAMSIVNMRSHRTPRHCSSLTKATFVFALIPPAHSTRCVQSPPTTLQDDCTIVQCLLHSWFHLYSIQIFCFEFLERWLHYLKKNREIEISRKKLFVYILLSCLFTCIACCCCCCSADLFKASSCNLF